MAVITTTLSPLARQVGFIYPSMFAYVCTNLNKHVSRYRTRPNDNITATGYPRLAKNLFPQAVLSFLPPPSAHPVPLTIALPTTKTLLKLRPFPTRVFGCSSSCLHSAGHPDSSLDVVGDQVTPPMCWQYRTYDFLFQDTYPKHQHTGNGPKSQPRMSS